MAKQKIEDYLLSVNSISEIEKLMKENVKKQNKLLPLVMEENEEAMQEVETLQKESEAIMDRLKSLLKK